MSEPRKPNQNSPAAKPNRIRKAKAAKATPEVPPASAELTSITRSDRQAMIATAAYYRAEKRHFAPGGELEDWIGAESEVDALLMLGERRS
jgi:Protein of unknown function (DUF2934)